MSLRVSALSKNKRMEHVWGVFTAREMRVSRVHFSLYRWAGIDVLSIDGSDLLGPASSKLSALSAQFATTFLGSKSRYYLFATWAHVLFVCLLVCQGATLSFPNLMTLLTFNSISL